MKLFTEFACAVTGKKLFVEADRILAVEPTNDDNVSKVTAAKEAVFQQYCVEGSTSEVLEQVMATRSQQEELTL